MSYPKTAQEWWSMMEAKKNELRNIVTTYHPASNEYDPPPMKITASGAESVCEGFRQEIKAEGPIDIGSVFDQAVTDRDGNTVLSLFNSAWFGVPESREEAFAIPSFGLLCDLCSEGPSCLNPEEDE